MEMLKSLIQDVKKVLPLLIIGSLMIDLSVHIAKLFGYPENAGSLKNMGGALVALSLTHVARRILFPKLQVQSWIQIAKVNPIAIAICFASMIYLVTQLFTAFTAMFVQ